MREVNIANRLTETASRLGDRPAIHVPKKISSGKIDYDVYTFADVQRESNRFAIGFEKLGISRGVRTLLAVKPGFELIALTFALFKVGAVPVLIDPGMGKNNLLDCIESSAPEAMIAIEKAFLARCLYRKKFSSISKMVTVGRRWFWGGTTLADLMTEKETYYHVTNTKADETAAILFTTGSTGPPKGVVYTHGVFDAQCELIQRQYDVTDEDVDLPAFPLFALFSIALGMRVVIPVMDPTRPASVDPEMVINAVNDQGVTFTFGSPAIWIKVARYCASKGVRLPSLKRVLMAGAPVPAEIHKLLLENILPEGASTHTPFGATESLPVADISGEEVLAETADKTSKGEGVCVGYPLLGIQIMVVKINDYPMETVESSETLPEGVIGEILVSGPVVTKQYFNNREQTSLHKVTDERGLLWHRMGDVGYKDAKGRLWFCGRKGHRVVTGSTTHYTIPVEAIFNQIEGVARTALVGIGDKPDQQPLLVVEPEPSYSGSEKDLAAALFKVGAENDLTKDVEKILFHKSFPVDIRHNAKIFREKLKVWAEERVGKAFIK